MKFVGRKKELELLDLLLKKKSASFVVIRGRRRIGKSRLIQEFSKDKKSLLFSGLPPLTKPSLPKNSRQRQIDAFASQMTHNTGMPKLQTSDWNDLFWHLGSQVKQGRLVVVFDEISWMASNDDDFLGYLKNLWDLYLSKNPELIFIVCGSVSSWIEKNILSNTGFLGRISVNMALDELSLSECQEFWGNEKNKVSAYEKFKVLSITGGVPKYLEEIIFEEPAETNIKRLCFHPEGLLFCEYEQIFSDLFSKKATSYKRIVDILAQGALGLDEICAALQVKKSGAISKYLQDLKLAGFIAQDTTWNLKSNRISQLACFRLRDNYLRFYAKYIQPNKESILLNLFQEKTLSSLPNWEVIMGLQFENLVLNNLKELCALLRVPMQDVVMAGPFFQRSNQRQKGCQIDLLIQTTYHTLYLCEIKFCASEVQKKVSEQVKEKISRLSCPTGYSVRPVLIHVNGISQAVKESALFSHIIDFADFFK